MNLALEHAVKFNEEAAAKLRRRVIVVNQEEDTAYGWVFFHPETDSIIDIRFHDAPRPTLDLSKVPF